MELLNGRPGNAEGRLPREMRTYDLLDSIGIEYQRTDHERTDTMEACLEVDGILGVVICKNLFLCNRQKTAFYLLMMPGSCDSASLDPGPFVHCLRAETIPDFTGSQSSPERRTVL